MMMVKKTVKVLVVISFFIMVVVNALASILPINGIGTGEVSDYYANLFAPSGLTFAVWGLIYLLLAVYMVYQLTVKKDSELGKSLLNKVGLYFTVSSAANTLWIFTWHYDLIYLSIILMAVILVCLIVIVSSIRKEQLSGKEKICVKLPFSIYFGWITVATIANVTTLLVSLGWNGFGLSEALWTVIVLAVGAVIAIVTIIRYKDYPYGLVILWAYAGILLKHLSPAGFGGMYMEVIIAAIACLALVAAADIYAIIRKKY